jgi:hypothetical protein
MGDFTGDGAVNFADLVILAQHCGTGSLGSTSQFGDGFAADWALAQSMVPEPTTLVIVPLAAGVLARRRMRCD